MKKLQSFLGMTTRFTSITLIALGLAGCSESGQADPETEVAVKLPTIAIIGSADFVGDTSGVGINAIPDELADRIIERLSQSKRFRVVERSATRRLVMEQRFEANQPVRDLDRVMDTAVSGMSMVYGDTLFVAGALGFANDALNDFKDLGSLIGADYVVYAKLERVDSSSASLSLPGSNRTINKQTENALIQLRAINANEGVLLGAASIKTSLDTVSVDGTSNSTAGSVSDNRLFDALAQDSANRIIDMVSPATIVKGSPLVINRGASDGVTAGDKYLVKRAGDSVTDVSGADLGPLLSDVGHVTVSEVQDAVSVVTAAQGQPAEGDLVFLISDSGAAQSVKRSGATPGVSSGRDSGQATLAIGKFVIDGSGAGSLVNDDIGQIREDLLVKLGDTRRFQLMERTQVDQLLDEKLFTQNAQGGDMTVALAALEGADYLIYGRINRFSIDVEQETIPVVKEIRTTTTGNASFHLRIVDVHTGKVLAADKVNVSETMEEANRDELLDLASSAMVEGIMDRLYPIKVLAAEGKVVYFNRGLDGGIQTGERYQVWRLGSELVDPDTGISFGAMESEVAELEVTEVERSRSKASIVSSSSEIRPGDLLKKSRNTEKPDPRANERQVRKPNF